MKKITLVVALVVCMSATFAQKYGHVNSTEIMKALPGIDSVEIKLMDFHKNMQIIYENMVSELQTKKEKLDKEAGTMTSSVRKLREDELIALQNRIQEFSMNAQDDVEEQQQILLAPFQEKLQNAINDVAKENKYSYIFDVNMLLYYDGGDDVTPLVKKKLGIK